MNNVVRLRKTSMDLAMKGNNVLMTGRILNKREVEAMNNTVDVVVEPVVEHVVDTMDTVEIAPFVLRLQEERKIAREKARRQAEYRATKKKMKAPTMQEVLKKKALAFIAKTISK